MKFTSDLVSTASGKLGGLVASHNRGGQYFRRLATPVNPNTSAQVTIRSIFSILAANWVSPMSPTNRALWNNWALMLGDGTKTGFNLYVAANVLRLQGSLSRIDPGPVVGSLASLTPPVPTANTANTSVAFTNSDAWATAVGGALLIFESPPFSSSRLSYHGQYRFAGKVLGAVTPPTSPVTVLHPFITTLTVGQQVSNRFISVLPDGRYSPVVTTYRVVT